ncbi:pilus assembly protein [Halopseudomonas pelagia]|uniref:pilus assembly protein n=1 Tax=Halopseudomonas pelagia TaxID=553151 RepID=UPI00039BCD57|nr:PilC/PilY family type IV pilus protein [Halopseudomonas pelagia]
MNSYKSLTKAALSCLAFSLYLHGGVAHAAALDVSQQPLMLVDSVAPNLIFTIDDSGSMKRSHVPDSIAADATMRTKRVKSATFNPAYYDPNTSYIIPKGVAVNGSDIIYGTSFSNAYHMGFKTGLGSANLATNYRVTWYCTRDQVGNCAYGTNGFSNIKELAENPAEDFDVSANLINGASTTITTPGGMVYTIERTANATCRVTGAGYVNSAAHCTQNSGGGSRTASVNLRQQPVAAYYYVFDATRAGCSITSIGNDDCYRVQLVDTAEQQNFATWYSFYRDRALATQSAAHLAFYDLPSAVRFTWQALNNCTSFNNGTNCNDNRFRIFGDRQKSNFLSWLTDVSFSGGTPLRASLDRAGKFLETNTAWANEPNPFNPSGTTGSTISNPQYACRPSFHIMMTDGIWNGANGSPNSTLRADHSNFNLPDGQSYSNSRRPYADATTNTLADLAMHYWATDLNTGLDNEVKPYTRFTNTNAATQYWDARNNPATWQNMTNYMVGLGLGSSLNNSSVPWEKDTFQGGYANILNGTANWPAAGDSNANNVYDLWHAAVNSRGEFFSADSPEELVTAFNDIINRIAERNSTAGRPGVSSSVSLNTSDPSDISIVNRIFESSYDSTAGWTGDLVRKDVRRLSNGLVTIDEEWSASERITAQGTGRNIYMGGDSAIRPFNWTNLSPEQQALFNLNPDGLSGTPDARGGARVNYIRGHRAGEGTGTTDFRARTSVFGDIINSAPAVVGTAGNVPYLMDRIDGARGEYLAYLRRTADRPELVYVGANDGMLHAIHTADGDGYLGGEEAFAFIPDAVITNLPSLTGQSYQGGEHRFFVDGSPIVRDVYIGGEWRTVLVGTLRAGGKSIFALDITDPGSDGSGVELLWEISNESDDYSDLGYTFARPEIVRLHSGQWAVLLGNGYDSTNPDTGVNDVAALFVIDISNGEKLTQLTVDDGSDLPNGLSSVRGADNNSDGIVDYAYAGDLRGNLWRFDLVNTGSSSGSDPFARANHESIDPSSFRVAYGGQPMFKARFNSDATLPQSITAIPSLVRHPSRLGYLVIVGTGKYFETSDAAPDTSKANSIYAVWDRYTRAQNTSAALALANRGNMEQRTITSQANTTFTGDAGSTTSLIRVISDGRVEWYNPGTTPIQEASESNVRRRGWFLDLRVGSSSLEGEMMVNEMLARGNTLLFGTTTPNEDPCADGLTSFIYGINAQTGARTLLPPFDFNRDGRIDAGDSTSAGIPPSGIQIGAPGGVALTGDGLIYGNDDTLGFFVPPAEQGRQTWQYLLEETP